jgi:hypothetical protein
MEKTFVILLTLLISSMIKFIYYSLFSTFSHSYLIGTFIISILVALRFSQAYSKYKRLINISLLLVISELNLFNTYELEIFLVILILLIESKNEVFKDKDYYIVIFAFKFMMDFSSSNLESIILKLLAFIKAGIYIFLICDSKMIIIRETNLEIEGIKVNGIFVNPLEQRRTNVSLEM